MIRIDWSKPVEPVGGVQLVVDEVDKEHKVAKDKEDQVAQDEAVGEKDNDDRILADTRHFIDTLKSRVNALGSDDDLDDDEEWTTKPRSKRQARAMAKQKSVKKLRPNAGVDQGVVVDLIE